MTTILLLLLTMIIAINLMAFIKYRILCASECRNLRGYWKVPFRQDYSESFFDWVPAIFQCHVWLRFFNRPRLIMAVLLGAAIGLLGCSATQLQQAQTNFNTVTSDVGDVIGIDGPTFIAELQDAGALNASTASKTVAALAKLQSTVTALHGTNITSVQGLLTGIPAVDTAIQASFFPGTATANDVAVANNILALAQKFIPAPSPTPTPAS